MALWVTGYWKSERIQDSVVATASELGEGELGSGFWAAGKCQTLWENLGEGSLVSEPQGRVSSWATDIGPWASVRWSLCIQ